MSEAKAFEFRVKVMLSDVDWGVEKVEDLPPAVKAVRDSVVAEFEDLERELQTLYPALKPRLDISERIL